MESSEFFSTVKQIHADARRRGLFFQTVEDTKISGRHLSIQGRRCLSFASCSYLGLEHHPDLKAGAHDFIDRYGTQFSASRGYVSLSAHRELEETLDTIFDGASLLATSTTLAHQIALPVLASEADAIVMDHQIHHSVHMAATLARASGTHIELVRHGQLEQAVDLVDRLSRIKRRVWFACDGVFSMFGDLAPLLLLKKLLALAPNVYLYIDDAHGMSWAGRHGRGSFLSRMPPHPRLVVATSLNKAFSAGGGCVVFPNREMCEQVRLCAGPVVFSGPLQPPMLGAALASARLHLSPEIIKRQDRLQLLVQHCNARAHELDLPLLVTNKSPILFFRCGLPRVAFGVAERLLEKNIYVTASAYPSVPMKTAGIRVSLTTEHTPADIDLMCEALSVSIPEILERQSLSREEVDRAFANALPEASRNGDSDLPAKVASGQFLALSPAPKTCLETLGSGRHSPVSTDRLTIELASSIQEIDPAIWDPHMATLSCSSWQAMADTEQLFSGHREREHNWTFRYVIVRDREGHIVAMTYFTFMLIKDDMLMRAEVSSAIESYREADPYFLTSEVVCMGSGFSEGRHLYLDREGPWRAALTAVLTVALEEYEARDAGLIMLRDFHEDSELASFLLDSGFIKVPMLDSHTLEVTWTTTEAFMARLSKRRRKRMRKVQELTPMYRRRVATPEDAHDREFMDDLYTLYRNVADRKLRLNTFPLPSALLPHLARSKTWELVSLHLAPEAGGPKNGAAVAWYAAHDSYGHYMPLVCGLDYTYVYSHGAYRQMLYQIVLRAQEVGARHIHLGMDADLEKDRFRTHRMRTCAYVHTRDDFIGAQMREVVAEVGLTR